MRLSLDQMREWKRELAGMDDTMLQNVVVYNRDRSLALPSHPWSFYHLARDEQINRNTVGPSCPWPMEMGEEGPIVNLVTEEEA
jgi:hypothetical protein